MHTRPIWAEISRTQLLANLQSLRTLASPHAEILAVVKADAYGHSVAHCAPWLVQAGMQWLGVTSVEEGMVVRARCPQAEILVLCCPWPGEEVSIVENRLTPTLWTPEHVDLLAHAAAVQQLPPRSIPVHVELDTGMSRQGVLPQDLPALLEHLRKAPVLSLQGVFTHFASPENLDSPQNDEQQAILAQCLRLIRDAGFAPQWVHAGNSSTVLAGDRLAALAGLATACGARLLVRPGLALYGYALPFVATDGTLGRVQQRLGQASLQPVLRWKTRVAGLRTVQSGTAIGYGASHRAPHTMHLALLPVGYADGLSRRLSNQGRVVLRGQLAPIVGRISMDLTVIDVSHIPHVAIHDEVMLIGEQRTENGASATVTAEDHAGWAQTIPYEILCSINVRVPRVAAP